MSLSLRPLLVAFAIFSLLSFVHPALAAEDKPGESLESPMRKKAAIIGRRIPDVVLPDVQGKLVAFSDFREAKALVVLFTGTQCPIANGYVPTLLDLQKRYAEQGVQVIGINPTLSDSVAMMAEHAKEYKISFPMLKDSEQTATQLFEAQRTPEAFVLDRRRNVRYVGRIDDRISYDYKRAKPKRKDLEEALKEVLAGKTVSVSTTAADGCLITPHERPVARGKVTYAKHVAAILQSRCADCHHPDTAAPFSLLTYNDARNWSAMIKETVLQRRMPPWNADPRHGKFSNDLRMTQQEIDTVVEWIDAGTPLGDEKDLPPAREFEDGWMIGKPDKIFKMPREYKVQAEGTVKYQYFVTPTNFKEDVWVQAAEARPGNRSVVHHIIVFYRKPGSTKKRALPAIVGTAPGEEPMIWPKGVGVRVPAGAELVWQLHYTPTGKEEIDQSEVGLIFCNEPPEREAKSKAALTFLFRIPPGAEDHRVVSKTRFDKDVELLSLMPHMHLRGSSFKYVAKKPDGSEEILLSVPQYDFNWQHRYRFAKPRWLPRGTTIHCEAHFDNSAENPANPDPSKPVTWGDQTWEEMMIGFINYVEAEPRQDPPKQEQQEGEK